MTSKTYSIIIGQCLVLVSLLVNSFSPHLPPSPRWTPPSLSLRMWSPFTRPVSTCGRWSWHSRGWRGRGWPGSDNYIVRIKLIKWLTCWHTSAAKVGASRESHTEEVMTSKVLLLIFRVEYGRSIILTSIRMSTRSACLEIWVLTLMRKWGLSRRDLSPKRKLIPNSFRHRLLLIG